MSFTVNVDIMTAVLQLVGLVEFVRMCHLAPIAPENGMSED
jgi:hypothetical protein